MRFKSLAFHLIVFFAIIGVVLSTVFVHELSHWQDYHKFVSNDNIYLFKIDGNFSSFTMPFAQYTYQTKNVGEVSKITRYTEYKAYAISSIIFIVYMVCQTIVVNEYFRRQDG